MTFLFNFLISTLFLSVNAAPITTEAQKPNITCLFMVDMQSSGISQAAVDKYQTYFNFAQLVASKLNDASHFTGYLDTFEYNGGLGDHESYPTDNYADFKSLPFPIGGTDDTIDLDLKNIDKTLSTAKWVPPVKDQTCLIIFSAASEALYQGTRVKTTYASFQTVLGVLLGCATTIPGLTNPNIASSLSDSDAEAVVEKLLDALRSA